MNDYKKISESWDKIKPIGRGSGKSFWLSVKVAVEKQIPKKILFSRNMMTKECSFVCPYCARIVESVHTYCWNCGQKLDWNEEDGR